MILLIDNYDSFTYNLYQALRLFCKDVHVVRHDKITVQEVNELNPMGIVLSPGPGRPENAGICIDLIRYIIKKRYCIPFLGVCLGHQAIAVALGGRVIQSDEVIHGKEDHISHCQTGLYQKLSLPFVAGRYHSLIIERETLPASLIIEAENQQKLIMGIRHHELPIFGVQFHPESILTLEGNLLLKEFVEICKKGTSYAT